MTESNNVVDFSEYKKNKAASITPSVTAITPGPPINLEEQPLPTNTATVDPNEDHYKNFVTDPHNINNIEFIMNELMKNIALQFPDIIACRFGDVLFLKEAVISLIMRSLLKQDHPFQKMADGLEKAFNRVTDDSTK